MASIPLAVSGRSGKSSGTKWVQRCVQHKERNVLDHLRERARNKVKRNLRRARGPGEMWDSKGRYRIGRPGNGSWRTHDESRSMRAEIARRCLLVGSSWWPGLAQAAVMAVLLPHPEIAG